MADVVSRSSNIKFKFYFVDGDTRTHTLKNPKGNITTSEIEDLQTFMRTNNVLLGDKVQGTFGKIEEVVKTTERKVYLDF